MKGLRITTRGIIVLITIAAAIFGVATGNWTYYDYESTSTTIQEIQP